MEVQLGFWSNKSVLKSVQHDFTSERFYWYSCYKWRPAGRGGGGRAAARKGCPTLVAACWPRSVVGALRRAVVLVFTSKRFNWFVLLLVRVLIGSCCY